MTLTHSTPSRTRRRAGATFAALSAAAVLSTGALVAGPATPAAAAPAPAPTCPVQKSAPKHEMRGEWIASVQNIDWPSKPGLTRSQSQAELRGFYDEAKTRGLNSVVVQVRPSADTLWPSRLEPWSKFLTGQQGRSPGWDPMAFAVREAHKRGLEFHAWFNPYRVTDTGTDLGVLTPDHPARRHPDWVVAYGGKLYYNPGIPAVRRHTVAVITEAVRRYDIDGVHFDDYFYPYPVAGQTFDDAAAYARYGAGRSLADWRRGNVDALIRDLDRKIHRLKPWVSFGVSPFAVWRNAATDPRGSATTAGAQTYDDLYADTRRWVRQGWVDYIAPQVYWSIGFAPADYAKLVPWWNDVVAGTGVDLYIGQATYKVGTSTQSPEWSDPAEMTRHLTFNDSYPRVQGDIYFSAKDVRADRLGHWEQLQARHYPHPALPPVTDGSSRVQRPRKVSVHSNRAGARVQWRAADRATGYAVYRVDGRVDACATADARHLVAVLGPQTTAWRDADGSRSSHYLVTAVAQNNAESAAVPARRR